MRIISRIVVGVLFAVATFVGVRSAVAADVSHPQVAPAMKANTPVPVDNDSFYDDYIHNCLEVGTRLTYFSLLDNKRGQPNDGSFFGTVTMLDERQNYLPKKLFVQYKIIPYAGVGLSYDSFSFDASDFGGSDGKATLSGPLFYVFGRYPNSTAFTPFCELGVAYYTSTFDADAGWLGTNPGKSVDLDNTHGYYVGAGCDLQITDDFSLNVYARYMRISDVTGAWYDAWTKFGDVVLTPSYVAFGLGAKYSF